MKTKEEFQSTKAELKGYYKFIYVCKKCGIFYGYDHATEQKYKLCPFCERESYMPRGNRKK